MRQFSPCLQGLALLTLSLSLAACNQGGPPPSTPASTDWRDQSIYWALTDRFHNGNPANDNGANRDEGDRADRSNPLGWHGGDFAGITQKIREGYFQKLGFTAIWISPVTLQVRAIPVESGPNQGRRFAGYHGYWAEDFFQVDPHFGSLEELKTLVRVAHENGLKIIQDMVVNHAGYGSPLVTAHPEWFHTQAECDASSDPEKDCPLAGLPDFKQSVPEAKRYLDDAVNYWVRETGIDGIRMDTIKHADDAYWRSFFAAGGPGDPKRVWTVGEAFNFDPAFLARYMDELGAPSVFDFALYGAVRDSLSGGGDLTPVADVFALDTVYRDPTRLTTFVDNHDVKRFVSESQDRGVSADIARERLDLALSLIFTARGTPSVYYGSEIGLAGKGDPYDHPPGQGNRENMDFSQVSSSPLAARLTELNRARREHAALRRGQQQELWRPNGGPNIFAFRRVLEGAQPVVVVLNNSDQAVNLGSLEGGGIPLLGTFAGRSLREVTGRASDLEVSASGRLVGTVPARTLLAVTAPAGSGGNVGVNPGLANVEELQATAGEGAVRLGWKAPADPQVLGYRIYRRSGDAAYTAVNFAPLPRESSTQLLRGLQNGREYEFKVVSVDAQNRESGGVTVRAAPDASARVTVEFEVDARSQGNGQLQLRRFDTGSQILYPMQPDPARPGYWKTSIELPRYREIRFKFGNGAANARNSGYEAPNQPDRSLLVEGGTFKGTYDYITAPVPASRITGRVASGGQGLGNASVSAATLPELHYALTFGDGSYSLPAPEGPLTLTARAPGHQDSAPLEASAPAENVNFDLEAVKGKYVIDGDLSDWSAPKATLSSPQAGVFGPDNNLLELQVDFDDQNLYLAYRYRAAGNSAIVYLDLQEGGASSAAAFEAWPRRASFAQPVDFFLARYENQAVQLRRVVSDTSVPELPAAAYSSALSGSAPEYSAELALPWTSLGFASRPGGTLRVTGGIFGGDGYGAGDIAPDATSSPAAPENTIGSEAEQRSVTFGRALEVSLD
ncbi:glycosidase [Deinobacterium chartae]|uniref:Glycosidase n=1 Tax=Deinobacterium chartae TaxID=521158 RepID=A0A841HYF3_9DEIO|nr:alpha-amylase family glycosyl hydrolase [Deinobacterium chartae]MBB6097249.1 glycosidase [Deinobacterium chartae]